MFAVVTNMIRIIACAMPIATTTIVITLVMVQNRAREQLLHAASQRLPLRLVQWSPHQVKGLSAGASIHQRCL